MNYFATAVQGVGSILLREMADCLNLESGSEVEFDGRNDLVAFEAPLLDPSRLRIAEDVYVSTAEANSQELGPLLRKLMRPEEIERSLSVYASISGPLKVRMTYRVVARVLSEQLFKRTELRSEATDFLGRLRPKWRQSDPADLEFWLLQTRPDLFRLGLRLTRGDLRSRGGRNLERPGALKPTVAAAMIYLAGKPSDLRLLDPACGSGTILSEALRAGWKVVGSDVEDLAIEVAASNVAGAGLLVADAREMPFRAQAFGAAVSNFPFGKQYRISGSPRKWFHETLRACQRAVVRNGSVVILVPGSRQFKESLEVVPELEMVNRYNLRLRGQPTAMWDLRNSGP